MKKILLLVSIALTSLSFGQNVPSYVPTNGLEVYYDFIGDANERINSLSGNVYGANLTTDINGSPNSAYHFNGTSDYIGIPHEFMNGEDNVTNTSFRIRFKVDNIDLNNEQGLWNKDGSWREVRIRIYPDSSINLSWAFPNYYADLSSEHGVIRTNEWYDVVFNNTTTNPEIYINGQLIQSTVSSNFDSRISFSQTGSPCVSGGIECNRFGLVRWGGQPTRYFRGSIDEFSIWSRVLSQEEITSIYNECNSSISSQPIDQIKNINNNAQFIVTSSDLTSTYQWQTDLGVGFQNLNNVLQYNGTTNDTLNVLNVTMNNNNQPFRCIISSGSCSDTSNIAVLTVNNTVGIDENKINQSLVIYPNPTQNQINLKGTSDFIGSTYIIFNNVGKTVLTGHINSENTIIELNNLKEGTYLLSIDESLNKKFTIIKK